MKRILGKEKWREMYWPFASINLRARGRVSRNSQSEGMLMEHRLNSLHRKGTSKVRPLWATNKAIPPGISRLLTYRTRIGIKSFILSKKQGRHINQLLSFFTDYSFTFRCIKMLNVVMPPSSNMEIKIMDFDKHSREHMQQYFQV